MSKKQNIPRDTLIEYFEGIAKYLGQSHQSAASEKGNPEHTQAGYSLFWYFKKFIRCDLDKKQPKTYSPLLDAYLGAPIKEILDPAPIDPEDQRRENELLDSRFPDSTYQLNKQQRKAVHKALHYSLSIIKGPPGTGKTETILRIAALAVAKGETVAVVSTNFSAVKNIEDKLDTIFDKHQKELTAPDFETICKNNYAFNAAVKHASLGSSARRKTVADRLTNKQFRFKADKVHGVAGWEQEITFSNFTKSFPFITSTIHSLKKCFSDGADSKYDLLIMDEASQSNHIVGIVALSCAKRIVIVGDEEQLPPVLTEAFRQEAEQLAKELELLEYAYFSPYNFNIRNASFLQSCYEVFVQTEADDALSLKTMLTEHHRCHPAIIQFCNQYIYDDCLEIKTNSKDTNADLFPISILWYEGDYRERIQLPQNPREKDGATIPSSYVNRKQLSILRTEEHEHLKSLIQRERSICILSPFKGQIALVKTYLQELLDEIGGSCEKEIISVEQIGEGELEGSSCDRTCALTIHKSQGQEFDVVYLLPVEDGNWEWPWSQGKRLVNVAVSRAKHELRVILSTKLMSDEAQKELARRQVAVVKPALEEDDETDEQMYVRKLVDYARETYANLNTRNREELKPEFGIHKSRIVSIFDDIPFKQSPKNDSCNYAPETCIEDALATSMLEGLCFAKNVTFDQILIGDGDSHERLADRCNEFYASASQAHFDFVVFDPTTGQLILAIEVDGAHHRSPRKADGEYPLKNYDNIKDSIVRNICNASLAWLGPIHDDSFSRGTSMDGYLESRQHSEEDESSASPDTHSGEIAPITVSDWHCAPDDLSANLSSFVFLRIPSDGSTYWETDALSSSFRPSPSSSSFLSPPTIEDYIRCQLGFNENESDGRIFVSKKIRQSNGPISISKCLKKWKQKPELKQKLKTINAQVMNKCLLYAGYHYFEDETHNARKPTEKGREIGIKSETGRNGNGTYVFPVYTQAAQSHILQNLDFILGYKDD